MKEEKTYQGHRAVPDRDETRRPNRRGNRRLLLLCAAVLVLIAIGAAIWWGTTRSGGASAGSDTDSGGLTGSWVYDEYTRYEFESDGNGCMYLDDTGFSYTYTVEGDQLSLDFESEALRDCTYTYAVEGDSLTLIGGEGTTGGSYELTRQR